jgi:hypothetical protein
MFELDAEAAMAFRVLGDEAAILPRKAAESGSPKIFLIVAGVKLRAQRYNRP